jgi:hypothetical protein
MNWGINLMVVIACVAAAIVILALGLLFYRANAATAQNGRRDLPAAKNSLEDQKDRATGIN